MAVNSEILWVPDFFVEPPEEILPVVAASKLLLETQVLHRYSQALRSREEVEVAEGAYHAAQLAQPSANEADVIELSGILHDVMSEHGRPRHHLYDSAEFVGVTTSGVTTEVTVSAPQHRKIPFLSTRYVNFDNADTGDGNAMLAHLEIALYGPNIIARHHGRLHHRGLSWEGAHYPWQRNLQGVQIPVDPERFADTIRFARQIGGSAMRASD
ncbi:MAG TPA: hypothetical protein VLH38_04540 [Patescibacteria group bacterium]|nr:hypothetical protein [Patescibacteria group bacterium]